MDEGIGYPWPSLGGLRDDIRGAWMSVLQAFSDPPSAPTEPEQEGPSTFALVTIQPGDPALALPVEEAAPAEEECETPLVSVDGCVLRDLDREAQSAMCLLHHWNHMPVPAQILQPLHLWIPTEVDHLDAEPLVADFFNGLRGEPDHDWRDIIPIRRVGFIDAQEPREPTAPPMEGGDARDIYRSPLDDAFHRWGLSDIPFRRDGTQVSRQLFTYLFDHLQDVMSSTHESGRRYWRRTANSIRQQMGDLDDNGVMWYNAAMSIVTAKLSLRGFDRDGISLLAIDPDLGEDQAPVVPGQQQAPLAPPMPTPPSPAVNPATCTPPIGAIKLRSKNSVVPGVNMTYRKFKRAFRGQRGTCPIVTDVSISDSAPLEVQKCAMYLRHNPNALLSKWAMDMLPQLQPAPAHTAQALVDESVQRDKAVAAKIKAASAFRHQVAYDEPSAYVEINCELPEKCKKLPILALKTYEEEVVLTNGWCCTHETEKLLLDKHFVGLARGYAAFQPRSDKTRLMLKNKLERALAEYDLRRYSSHFLARLTHDIVLYVMSFDSAAMRSARIMASKVARANDNFYNSALS